MSWSLSADAVAELVTMAAASPAGGVGNEACFSRLQREYTHLLRDPVPGVLAHPSPSSLLEWHYIISFEGEGGARDGEPARAATNGCTGSSGSGSGGAGGAPSRNTVKGVSDYSGGTYYGKMIFPSAYPFAPPSILMLTPSGRFSTNTRLCLSMSDYHPESWNPMWSVASILQGLLSVRTIRAPRLRAGCRGLAPRALDPLFPPSHPPVRGGGLTEVFFRRPRATARSSCARRATPPGASSRAARRGGCSRV